MPLIWAFPSSIQNTKRKGYEKCAYKNVEVSMHNMNEE